MKVSVLDLYPKVNYRISKDQNGGYGTANNYGDSWFSKILSIFVKGSVDFPPLYSVQTIGELKKKNLDIEFHKKLELNDNSDFYILTSSIVCFETEILAIKELKKRNKLIFVIGPFASIMYQSYIEAGAKVIKGEPEFFFKHIEIKSKTTLEKLPNLIENFPLCELDELAIPGWDVVFKNYVPKMKFLGNGPAVNINASRGCPYSCYYYCVYPLQQGRKLRLKSPKKILEEMNFLNEKLQVKNYVFRDPVFSINRKHTLELCNAIIQNKKKFNICIETHLKNIDEELAVILKSAGVRLVYVGIESGDENVRNETNRASEENDNQIKKINFLEKIGIEVKAMYIIGMPSDSRETFMSTLKFAKKILSSYAQFSVFTPYPGTPVYKDYKDKIDNINYEEFTQWQLVFKHNNFTKKDIRELLDYSYRSYYLNIKWIKKFILSKIRHLYEGLYNWLHRISRESTSKKV